jgi:hypothetical protein
MAGVSQKQTALMLQCISPDFVIRHVGSPEFKAVLSEWVV